jgi:antagonist of KipI
MGIRIQKQGIADSLRDGGRFGFQHLGIPPSGVMDPVALYVSNILVGNDPDTAVLEMHFPAPIIQFEAATLIAISGADFNATIDGVEISINQPIIVTANSVLRFSKIIAGARAYLAVRGGFVADNWLESDSTQILVGRGGLEGRNLLKNDRLAFKNSFDYDIEEPALLPWSANIAACYLGNHIQMIEGPEFELLNDASKKIIQENSFVISNNSNRMGYRMQGDLLALTEGFECLSSAVTMGTLQLLPDGNTILLMADHQTAGGYQRIGHASSASIPSLAQMNSGEAISYQFISVEAAEKSYLLQQMHLIQLKNACNFRLNEYFAND